MDTAIDYKALADAMQYYCNYGYIPIEVPWTVPLDDIMVTCPKESYATKAPDLAPNDYLVGSAEQGFIYIDRRGLLDKNKKYVACTPCFRNDAVDYWHQKYFMKVELYHPMSDYLEDNFLNEGVLDNTLKHVIQLALNFFIKYNPHSEVSKWGANRSNDLKCVNTEQGFDIELKNIELGSYGIRKDVAKKLCWIYGTGLAEPRFSKAIERINRG